MPIRTGSQYSWVGRSTGRSAEYRILSTTLRQIRYGKADNEGDASWAGEERFLLWTVYFLRKNHRIEKWMTIATVKNTIK